MIKYVRYKEVSLYRGSFPSILLLLGLGISFVISRTSLYGCSLNRRSTVPVQHCGRFARRRSLGLKSNRSWQTTLYKMVNLLLRDVILVNLGFHMCRTRAVTVFPCLFLFFSLKERQIPIGWIDLAWANCYRANRPDTHVHTVPEKTEIFFSGLVYRPHVFVGNGHRKPIFSKTLSRVETFENTVLLYTIQNRNVRTRIFLKKEKKNIRFQTKAVRVDGTPLQGMTNQDYRCANDGLF